MSSNLHSSIKKHEEPELLNTKRGTSNYFSSYLYVVETESFRNTATSTSATNFVGPTHPKIDVHQDSEHRAPALHGFPSTTGVKRRAQELKKPYRKRKCSTESRNL